MDSIIDNYNEMNYGTCVLQPSHKHLTPAVVSLTEFALESRRRENVLGSRGTRHTLKISTKLIKFCQYCGRGRTQDWKIAFFSKIKTSAFLEANNFFKIVWGGGRRVSKQKLTGKLFDRDKQLTYVCVNKLDRKLDTTSYWLVPSWPQQRHRMLKFKLSDYMYNHFKYQYL